VATSDVPTGITRLNDIWNRCAGTRGRCGNGRKREPPYEQEDDRNNKEEREKRSIGTSSKNVTGAVLNRVGSALRVLEVAVYTPHLQREVGNRQHEQVQLRRHCHHLPPQRQR
jgi:hypothetical protein